VAADEAKQGLTLLVGEVKGESVRCRHENLAEAARTEWNPESVIRPALPHAQR
jgi:hypothetical protein